MWDWKFGPEFIAVKECYKNYTYVQAGFESRLVAVTVSEKSFFFVLFPEFCAPNFREFVPELNTYMTYMTYICIYINIVSFI